MFEEHGSREKIAKLEGFCEDYTLRIIRITKPYTGTDSYHVDFKDCPSAHDVGLVECRDAVQVVKDWDYSRGHQVPIYFNPTVFYYERTGGEHEHFSTYSTDSKVALLKFLAEFKNIMVRKARDKIDAIRKDLAEEGAKKTDDSLDDRLIGTRI